MKDFFRQLTGISKPYSYQERAAEVCLNQKNFIISAPTGAGKTWAALLGYLYSKKQKKTIADRVFYVLPMRTLANNLFESTIAKCRNVFNVTTDVDDKRKNPDKLAVTIQTGEKREDPFFQGDIIFTTIDQLLSSYLNVPLSLAPKLANINAGALIGSLIIFDEVHLLDPERALITVIEMVKRLGSCAQYGFMTATLSTEAILKFQTILDAEYISVNQKELTEMLSHRDKQRVYKWVDKPLTSQAVLSVHRGGRSIIICNSVARAQALFRQLKEDADSATKIFLLHSRFFKKHRQAIEVSLEKYFGPNADKSQTDVILVTTQVVEVGIDISADNLHAELCPANALLQRAGRCARYVFPRNMGAVWVYELEQDNQGRPRFGPYRSESEIQAIADTRNVIARRSGEVLGFFDEQDIINNVHQRQEEVIFHQINNNLQQQKNIVNNVINTSDRSKISDLIRNIDSVNVVITDNPETSINIDKLPELLSLPRVTLMSLGDILESSNEQNWAVKIPVLTNDGQGDSVSWKIVHNKTQLACAGWLVALSPRIACYTAEAGLELGQSGLAPVLLPSEAIPWKPFSYEFETFQDHVVKTVEECRNQASAYRVGDTLLGQLLKLPLGFVDKLTELVCSLHDTGKLSSKWQGAARNWQEKFYPQYLNGDKPIAHTTFRYENGDHLKRSLLNSRGSHAAEGAFGIAEAVWAFLSSYFKDQNECRKAFKATISAIIRHHSGQTLHLNEFKFIENAEFWVNQALVAASIPVVINQISVPNAQDIFRFNQLLINAGDDGKWLLLYWLLVRRLRLADQGALKGDGGD